MLTTCPSTVRRVSDPLVLIRDCEDEDLAAISVLEERIYQSEAPWSEEDYLEVLSDEDAIGLVAIEDGRVVGYGFANLEDRDLEIIALTVAEGRRGLGIGRGILEELLRRGREAGAARANLDVREGNTQARALYVSVGFRDVGIRRDYYHRGVHAVRMRLLLR